MKVTAENLTDEQIRASGVDPEIIKMALNPRSTSPSRNSARRLCAAAITRHEGSK